MESYPSEIADAMQALARAAGSWAALQASGDEDGAAGKDEEIQSQYQRLEQAFEEDPCQLRDMAQAAGLVKAAEVLQGGEGLEDHMQGFNDAIVPTPDAVSESLWQRTQKLCWAAAAWACAEQQGDDATASRERRAFERHGRALAGFGPGRGAEDREAYHARAAEVMPATVVMFSGCADSQTSADVQNTASFGLPSDAGPGGAGGACTNSMVKALAERDDFSWVGLLQEMRNILDGEYTQIPQLSSSRPMDMNAPFSIMNPESNGKCRAVLIGINYYGTNAQLSGCINDVDTMSRYIEGHGFEGAEVQTLMDDGEHTSPTRDNIVEAMRWLVEGAEAGDSLFLHYSGHGASVRDDDGDEEDGKDETLCPVDYDSAGLLRDDEIFQILVAPLKEGVHLTCVLDCCHSGTILDLPYMFKADDNSLAAVADGNFSDMQPNPGFDMGRALQVIKDHPVLCAAAVVAGGVAFAFMSPEQRQQVGGKLMSLAGGLFG